MQTGTQGRRGRRWAAGALAGTAAVLATAALAPGASAAVQVGSSAWSWGNPLPQGNTITRMAFYGTTGYAVGEFGTLLKSTDGGTSWSGLPAGTYTALTKVQAVDANTVVAGGGCVARLSRDGGQTFSRIAFTPVESGCPQESQLAALSFLDGNQGFLVTQDGSVFATADGGASFANRTALPGTSVASGRAVPTALTMRSATEGFAATSAGTIFRTQDGGTSWTPVSDTQRSVNDILFVSDTVGYAVGSNSLLLKTSDGGATWVAKDAGAGQNLTSIRCADADHCIATTAAGVQLIRTDNGGDSFSFPTPATDPIYAAAFASPTRVVAIGKSGTTVTSDDGGVTYTPASSRLTGTYTGIFAGAQAGTAYAVGTKAALAVTTDGGRSWKRGNVTTSQDVRAVSFPSAQVGYALDAAGGVFRTANAGQTWTTLDLGTTARPNSLIAPSSSTVMAIGPRGVRRSTNGGAEFSQVKGRDVSRANLTWSDRAGSALFAAGPRDLLRSTDGGKMWKALSKPRVGSGRKARIQRLSDVDFVSAKVGFVVDTANRVWRTTDAGKRWTRLDGVGTDDVEGIAMTDSRRGYLVIPRFGDVNGSSGFLLRTTDGGSTWRPQFVVSEQIGNMGLASGTNGTDYLLAGTSSLLSTTTGGDRGVASALTLKAPKSKYTKTPKGSVAITGTLKPAAGKARVTVSYLRPGSLRWSHQTVTVSSNGRFTASFRLARGANTFVAQWSGDFRSRGAGTKPTVVRVGR